MNKRERLNKLAIKAFVTARDRGQPSKVSRFLACLDPWVVLAYANLVDKRGSVITRTATIKHKQYVFQFAYYVDKFVHPIIYNELDEIEKTLIEDYLLEE